MWRLGALWFLVPMLAGCAATFVGATSVGVGAAGVVAYQCPGWVEVTLRDELTGGELCGEPLEARAADEERRAHTCAPFPLGAGSWQIRALRGGSAATLVIEPSPRCEHNAYSIELTLPAPRPQGRSLGGA